MTRASSKLEALADQLRAAVEDISGRFGDHAEITRDGQVDCDPRRPGHIVRWEYNVKVPARPGAAELLANVVIPGMRESGWDVTNRDSAREFAVQFSQRGSFLGVHIARSGGHDVVIGGSTPCVAVRR